MNQRTSVALALLALAVGLAVALLAGPAAASHGDDNTDFTVSPGDRTPGASDVTYRLELEWTGPATGNAGMSDVDRVEFAVQNTDIEGCGESGFFGGTPYTLSLDDGSETQELSVADSAWNGNGAAFVLEDGSPEFRVGHTLILELDGCVQNGDGADWFLSAGLVEGPAVTEGQNVTLEGTSHYFGICEGCESDEDARESMGNPPSEPTPTPTATATATATATPTATSAPARTPVRVGSPTATSTPTGTSTPTDTPAETDDTADGDQEEDPPGSDPTNPEVFGMNPLAIVGIVAILSIGLAALGARRL